MKLKICQAGDPVLRQEARALSTGEILSAEVQRLIEMMKETMRDAPGVGLAAPQVGAPLQLAVIEDLPAYIDRLPPGHAAERRREPVPLQVVVNPTITPLGAEQAHFFEGCLSLAGLVGVVPRSLAVRVDALNEKAEPVVIEAKGWYARILQHEIDHLHGTLYVDRVLSRTLMTVENNGRFWKDATNAELIERLRLKPW